MHHIYNVKYIKDYTLELTFENNIIKHVDFSAWVNEGGVFDALLDKEYFRQVILNTECRCIEWPNGADVCPDVLFNCGKAVTRSNVA